MLRTLKFLNYIWIILVLTMPASHALPPNYCKIGDNGKLDNAAIEFFANLSINSLFTFNFVNYRELSNNSNLLSVNAWTQYNDYLNNSGLLKETRDQKLVVASYFKINANVLSKDNNSWQVNVPFILNSQSASSKNSTTLNATMTIVLNNTQAINCGLQVAKIQFTPEIKTSFFKNLFGIGAIDVPYQENAHLAMKDEDMDLKQPIMSDTAIITAANSWILKQNNFNPSLLNGPLIIIRKGILEDRYTWIIQVNNTINILVTRSANNPYGLDFKISN